MWYKYARKQNLEAKNIKQGIIWSGYFKELLDRYIDNRLINKLGFNKDNNIWAIIVNDNDTYDLLNMYIHGIVPDKGTERGCFNSFTKATSSDLKNLKKLGEIIGCPQLFTMNGLTIIKKDELDAALLAHEATHANRYRRSYKTDYTTNKEEIEATINEGIVERFLSEEGLPLSPHREMENMRSYLILNSGSLIDNLSLRNMFIRYVIMYSNDLKLDSQYLNRLAMRINIFFKSLYNINERVSIDDFLSRIILSLMHGNIDPDELLRNYENALHDILFNELHDKSMDIKSLNLMEYKSQELIRMFEDLINDTYDALEHKDYELAKRLLNTIDNLLVKATRSFKKRGNTSYLDSLDERLTELDKRLYKEDSEVFINKEEQYPEHPYKKYNDLPVPEENLEIS